jgi:hypothetical protein
MTEETERFVAEVPFASHLTDDQELDENYYVRHRVETVKRIRLTARTDALALARMVQEDYSAARKWSRYITEELSHDVLYLRDVRQHGIPEEAALAAPPFPATVAMVRYIEEEIGRVGSLAAVAYSLLVEWSSERYSEKTVVKATRAFSVDHVKGSHSHLGIDETEDHYSMMLEVASRVLDRAGGLPVLERLVRDISAFLRRYFTELYEATVGRQRDASAATASRPRGTGAARRRGSRNGNPDPGFLPTEEQVAFYQAHGWYVTPTILSPELLDRIRVDCLRFLVGERDSPLPAVAGLDWRQVESLRFKMPYVSLQMPSVRELVHLPTLGAIAARLARTPAVRLYRDALTYKPPARGEAAATRVGWHTDRAYWPTCSSDNMLTAWIPFADCDEMQGTLVVLDGSHRWPEHRERSFSDHDLDATLARVDSGSEPVVEVPIRVKKGQVSFHHCRLLHASRENRSGVPRLSLVIHLQDAANEYRPSRNAQGVPLAHLNDLLCRKLPTGDPDYADPAVCPILWSQTPLARTA